MSMRGMTRVTVGALALGALVAGVLTGCTSATEDEPDDPSVLRVLAGSEVKDMVPLLDEALEATGVRVELSYIGTIQGTEQVASGEAGEQYDAVWFPNNRYLSLLPGAGSAVKESVKIMSSPVVFGLDERLVADLGWDQQEPTWADIADAAATGRFSYGMTNPAASNSGFGALVSVATALSGTGAALTVDDIETVVPRLQEFASGQKLTAGSSGWLADKYRDDTDLVDGIINYESVLMGLRDEGVPMAIVTPTDGVVSNDYPLTLLSTASAEKAALFESVTSWLTTEETQHAIVDQVHRRPAVPGIDTGDAFPSTVLFETPFPNTLEVANELITTYLDSARAPSQEVFVLDTSGSMEGERIDALRNALVGLTGADTSTAGGFAQFRAGERVTLLPFSDQPAAPTVVDIPQADPSRGHAQIAETAEGLLAEGGTAIYDSVRTAYQLAARQLDERPGTFVSVVLMTDGENTDGSDLGGFSSFYENLPPSARAIPCFVVLFGDGNVEEMTSLAEMTGGQVFDARDGDLAQAFLDIRGYQ